MKKILLCGATHGSNFGDSLFAYMFKKSIENHEGDFEVIFTKASIHSKQKLGIKEATPSDLFSSDAMVYISGGYFGESHHETLKGAFYRFMRYFSYGLLMLIRRKPIAILGVGAGPLNRWFLRKTAVFIFNKAKIVSVRDELSKTNMKDYGVKNELNVTSDSAQVINKEIFKIQNTINNLNFSEKNELKDRKKVLLHINTTPDDNLYLNNVINAVKETLCLNQEYGFIVTTDSVVNKQYLDHIYNELPKERTIIHEFTDPLEFLEVIASVDAIITPKLHVGIIGSTYGKPVLSYPIHPGKTERYYQQIGFPNHCRSLYSLTKEDAKKMINNLIMDEIVLPDNIKVDAQRNFDLLQRFINNYVK